MYKFLEKGAKQNCRCATELNLAMICYVATSATHMML